MFPEAAAAFPRSGMSQGLDSEWIWSISRVAYSRGLALLSQIRLTRQPESGDRRAIVMFRAFVFGVLATIVIALVGGYFVLRNGIIPANADATPGWLETWAAGTSLDATLSREAQGTNPVALTDENLIAAIKLYGQHCAICHGTAKGEASASPVAKGLYPRPPQLATDGVEDDPESFSFWEIKHGIRWTGMPSWKWTLTDQQIWSLALFLKHMDKLPPTAEQAWQNVVN